MCNTVSKIQSKISILCMIVQYRAIMGNMFYQTTNLGVGSSNLSERANLFNYLDNFQKFIIPASKHIVSASELIWRRVCKVVRGRWHSFFCTD